MRQMRNRTMKSADLATLRALHGRKRWEHIWAYYKLPIIGILIVLYIFGYAAYRHFTKKEAVLYVSLVNISAGSDLTGQLTDGFAQDAHLTKKQQVNLLTGLIINETANADEQYVYASELKLLAAVSAQQLDVILMEEPENHLSFTTLRKMLHEISIKQKNSQIIVATHNNMIASRLNLNNVLWITENCVRSLSEVDKDVAKFFVKADDNAFLQLLLSNKVFLVEGATEFLLLPHFYKQITGKTIEDDGISVISCNGISYRNYLEIAQKTSKKISVLTDNDGKQDKIDKAAAFNKDSQLQHIFLGTTTDDWTWEACLYNLNKAVLDGMIEVHAGSDYLFHKRDYGQVLGKMLNNKVETAYKMLLSGTAFEIPQYIKDAIEWLRK